MRCADYCCYTLAEYERIAAVMATVRWQRVPIVADRIVCNNGGDGLADAGSIVALLDPPSQQRMMGLVERMESALVSAGMLARRCRCTVRRRCRLCCGGDCTKARGLYA